MTPHSSAGMNQTPCHDEPILSIEANMVDASNEGFSMHPADGGKDAWLFLLSCFMLEALIWGQFSSTDVQRWAEIQQGFLRRTVFFKNITVRITFRTPVT